VVTCGQSLLVQRTRDLAYDFIDITLSKPIQTLMGNAGGLPLNCRYHPDHRSTKYNNSISSLHSWLPLTGLAIIPDWPVAGYYQDLVSATQELMNGTKTPSQFLDEIAAPYNAALPPK